MAALKNFITFASKFILGLICFVMLYFLLAFILGITPVNRRYHPPEQGIEIFVGSNGVHTDIIVPVKTPYRDWSEMVPFEHFSGADSTFRYIAFGWGDKGFYIETPTWDDLTVTTALKSLFWPTPTAMHTEYFPAEPRTYQWQERLTITEDQYRRLINYVDQYFQKTPDGRPLLIEGAGYDLTDNFYEAYGKYHVYNTSNSWTNRGLKKIGVRAAVWSPFDRAIRHQIRKVHKQAARKKEK